MRQKWLLNVPLKRRLNPLGIREGFEDCKDLYVSDKLNSLNPLGIREGFEAKELRKHSRQGES